MFVLLILNHAKVKANIDPHVLEELADAVLKQNNDAISEYFIVDGGGNRPEVDAWIGKSMDLIIIPVMPEEQSVMLGLETQRNLEESNVNPNTIQFLVIDWPSFKDSSRPDAEKQIIPIPKDKIIEYMEPAKKLWKLSVNDKVEWKTPPAKFNNYSRKLYFAVNDAVKKLGANKQPHHAA